MSDLELRVLDPVVDTDLYREAYDWRPRHKPHVQPDRMSFETFASDNPYYLTIGLFNGEMQALYFLREVEPGVFEAHFTSRLGISREALLAGATEVARQILANGGIEIHAWVTPRNRPLRSFLESLGFTEVCQESFPCASVSNGATLPDKPRNLRQFVKYVLKG